MVKVTFEDGSWVGGGYVTHKQTNQNYSFYPGDICKVESPNKNKKKHRGRICRLTGTYRNYSSGTIKAGAVFLDTGKFGYVDADDLIPALPDEVAAQPHK